MWKRLQDLSYDPVFISRLRKAIGVLALLEVLCWILVCTISGLLYR